MCCGEASGAGILGFFGLNSSSLASPREVEKLRVLGFREFDSSSRAGRRAREKPAAFRMECLLAWQTAHEVTAAIRRSPIFF